jgi:hypothetical protein
MTPTPKWPPRPAERAARLRTSQRKHKEKVKHRIIDLESRLFGAECKLERALAAISRLSDELHTVTEQNKHLQSHRCSSEPILTSNPSSSSRAAQLSGATSHRQREHVQKLTLPWENDANPEDFSWSSAFLEGVDMNGHDKTISVAASTTGHPQAESVSEVMAVGTAGTDTPSSSTNTGSTVSHKDTDTLATATPVSPQELDLAHELYEAVDIAAMRDWIDPKFKRPFAKADLDRSQPSSLFALMDFISS